ncbi:MAG: efflux RND transporter permease subunit [Pseudomonadota bacterium]
MWITETSIKQPVFATMVMLAIVTLGAFAYQRLPVEQMPDVSNPVVSIVVRWPGASPEAVENDVIKPMEDVVNTVDGIKRIYATTREGVGFIQAEFRLDTDVAVAAQEMRDKVALVRSSFPREVLDPEVSRSNNDDNQRPVVELVVLSKTRSLRELSTLVDQVIVKRFQSSPGVANIAVNGEVVRQVQLFLKPSEMQAYGVGIDQVISAVKSANQDLPAGSISTLTQEQLVRVEGRIKSPEAFGQIIVTTQAGAPVYLSQVAEVVDGEEERTSLARVNGEPAIGLSVFKVQGSNIIEVGKGIEKAREDLAKRLPPDVEVRLIWSNAEGIKNSLDNVKKTIFEGAALTVLIVFLFLHSWRSTIITGLTLPISVIATFMAIHAMGFTLNYLTLMALSLCIGLLIDDAIVVRENIVRHLDMGKSHYRAALEGTQEIGLAVMATTFAILAVFVPVAFMQGIIGLYFYQFGITVAVAVLVSLFVSFTLDPMLSSIWRDPPGDRFKYLPWFGRLMAGIEHGIEAVHRVYGRVLAWALRDMRYRVWLPIFGLVAAATERNWRLIGTISRRGIVLWTAAAIFFGSFLIVPLLGSEFFPEEDEGFISVRMNTAIGSSLEYTDAKTLQVEEALKPFTEIETMSTEIGTEEGKNYSRVNLRLTNAEKTGRRSQKELEKLIRARVSAIGGIELNIGWNKPIFVSILGPDAAQLTAISQEVMAKMAKIPGIADLESSEKGANPTLAIRIDKERASDLGLSNAAIGAALRPLIAGETISYWLAPDGQNYDVLVRLPKAQREIASDLGALNITSSRLRADGTPLLVPLRQVAELVPTTSAQQIKRLDLQRRISLYAGAEGRPSGDVGGDVEKLIKSIELPPGYRFDIGGQQQEMAESFAAAMAALGLAVIFIYFILASQFGSFIQPVAIMATMPLSLAGVFIALLVTGSTLNIFSIIGFIMLMGLVTKNGILLVDFTNQGLREGKPLMQALLDAGQVRLRPILMTSFAMIFGMLPMAIGGGQGGESQAPMGRAVIGGIITSTVLTLVVVPVIYSFLHAMGQRSRRWFGSGEESHEVVDQPAR